MNRLLIAAAVAALGASALPLTAHAQSLPETQVDALEKLAGKQLGFRRAQAKGLCATGYFEGNTVSRVLSSASVFNGDKMPAVVRFSVGGGNPKANDKAKTVRGMAVQITGPKGEVWQTANISAPVYFVSKAEDFAPFVLARVSDPATGKPDPAKVKAFTEAHPETALQGAYLAKQPVPASFQGVNYWGVNAFEFVNSQGKGQFVRWIFEPSDGLKGLTDDQAKAMPDNFLADDLRSRVAKGPVSFDFRLQLADAGDQTVDPTKVWPAERKVLPAGRLVIDKVEADGAGACDAMTFNPLVLPKGIKPSADPVLNARPAAYGVSLGRRLGEKATMAK